MAGAKIKPVESLKGHWTKTQLADRQEVQNKRPAAKSDELPHSLARGRRGPPHRGYGGQVLHALQSGQAA